MYVNRHYCMIHVLLLLLFDVFAYFINTVPKKNRKHNGQKKKYKQRSTKHTYNTKDRVTRALLKTGVNSYAFPGELRFEVCWYHR
jgi:hypothetical protein